MRMEPADTRRIGGPSTGGAATGIVPAKVRAPRVRWLARERLDQLVPRLWQHRLTLVVAPAGSGKTTLLAAWAGLVDAPAAWYRAESVDGSERSLVAHLAAAFATVVPDLGPAWRTVDEAAAALDARPEDRLLLVIDDLHALTGTPAEAALERLLDYAPPSLAVVAGTRVAPSFNLSRRRVAGEILELYDHRHVSLAEDLGQREPVEGGRDQRDPRLRRPGRAVSPEDVSPVEECTAWQSEKEP